MNNYWETSMEWHLKNCVNGTKAPGKRQRRLSGPSALRLRSVELVKGFPRWRGWTRTVRLSRCIVEQSTRWGGPTRLGVSQQKRRPHK